MKIILTLEDSIDREEAQVMSDSFMEEPWCKNAEIDTCSGCGKLKSCEVKK